MRQVQLSKPTHCVESWFSVGSGTWYEVTWYRTLVPSSRFHLQRVTRVNLGVFLCFESERNGTQTYVYTFLKLCILTEWFDALNLSTHASTTRLNHSVGNNWGLCGLSYHQPPLSQVFGERRNLLAKWVSVEHREWLCTRAPLLCRELCWSELKFLLSIRNHAEQTVWFYSCDVVKHEPACYSFLLSFNLISHVITFLWMLYFIHWSLPKFDRWSDSQRRAVLQDFVQSCSMNQLMFLSQHVSRQLPLQAADFTCLLPRVLSLFLFSFLDPRSLCRCAQVYSNQPQCSHVAVKLLWNSLSLSAFLLCEQVSWHWKSIVELDQLWMPKCERLGWCIPFSPTPFEQGAWKRHYINTVQELRLTSLKVCRSEVVGVSGALQGYLY